MQPLAGTATTGAIAADSIFSLTCTGAGGNATQSVVVVVSAAPPPPVPTVTLNASPGSITIGDATLLTWSSTNATRCTASGAWSGTREVSGSASTGALTTDSIFTLSCIGPGGNASSSSANVAVSAPPPAPALTLNATPTSVARGNGSTLTWSSTNATSCVASGAWSGPVPVSGTSSTGELAADATFTLTCMGVGGAVSRSITLTVQNRVPVIAGSPPGSATVGEPYEFVPTAFDPDGEALILGISNGPSWATVDAITGRLSGTPAPGDEGTYANIMISASDGRDMAALAPFTIIVSPARTGSALLTWVPPTENTDGSPLVDLVGYRVYYGQDPNSLNQTMEITHSGLSSYLIEGLPRATWHFAVVAVNEWGYESPYSNIASKEVIP
jgi:Putative Ig domain